ncbi:hypothetical protein BVG19_g3765 [[Candida] boidinii]|nr:hypothetical protein BVG19_g3765 [[Candida] boidinii]OWB52601.1 hypothetical protein B5S27_g4178 [[Candida] boidinii]
MKNKNKKFTNFTKKIYYYYYPTSSTATTSSSLSSTISNTISPAKKTPTEPLGVSRESNSINIDQDSKPADEEYLAAEINVIEKRNQMEEITEENLSNLQSPNKAKTDSDNNIKKFSISGVQSKLYENSNSNRENNNKENSNKENNNSMTLPLYQNKNITNISNISNDSNEDSNISTSTKLQIAKDMKEIEPTAIETPNITNHSSPIKITPNHLKLSSLQDPNISLNEHDEKNSNSSSSSSFSSSSTENQNADISYGNQSTISFNTRFKFMEKFRKSSEKNSVLTKPLIIEDVAASKEEQEQDCNKFNADYNDLYNTCENNKQYPDKITIQDQEDFYKNYPRLFEFNNEDELYDLFNQFPTFKSELNQEIDRFEKEYKSIDSNTNIDLDADANANVNASASADVDTNSVNDDSDLPEFGTININDIKAENFIDNAATAIDDHKEQVEVKVKPEEKEEEDSNSSTEIVTDLSLSNEYSEDELTTTQPATNKILETSTSKGKLVNPEKADNTTIDKKFGTSPIYSLYVGDLDESISENELRKYFGKFKGFLSLKIPRDLNTGVSSGYAYINYQNERLAKIVLEELNYRQIGNKEIRIMPSIRDRKSRESIGENIFISNLPKGLKLREMYEIFREFGEILSCKLNYDKNFAFVHFKDKAIADQVVSYYKKNLFKGKEIFITVHVSKKNRNFNKFDNNDKDQFFPSNTSFDDKSFRNSEESPCKSGSVLPSKADGLKKIEMSNKEKEEFKNKLLASINSSFVTNESSTISSQDVLDKGAPSFDNGENTAKLSQWDFEEEEEDNEFDLNLSGDSLSGKVSSEHSIFVRNLPFKISKFEIKSIIEPFGKITSILVRQNKRMKASWSLVTLKDEQSVENCINGLNSLKVNDKILSVTQAMPREEKAYFNKNIIKMPANIFGYLIVLNNLNFNKNKLEFEKNYFRLKSIKYINFYDTLKLTVLQDFKEFKQVSESFPKISIEQNDQSYKFNVDFTKGKNLVHGYIELTSLNEREFFYRFLNKIGCNCYKIDIVNNNLKKKMRHHLIRQTNNGYFRPNNEYYQLKLRLDEFNKQFKMNLNQLKDTNNNSYRVLNKQNQKSIKYEESFKTGLFARPHGLKFGKENLSNEQNRGGEVKGEKGITKIKAHVDKVIVILIYKVFNINQNLNRNLNEVRINSIINNLIKFYWSNDYFKVFSNLQEDYSATIIKLLNNIIDTSYYLGLLPRDIKIKKIDYIGNQ